MRVVIPTLDSLSQLHIIPSLLVISGAVLCWVNQIPERLRGGVTTEYIHTWKSHHIKVALYCFWTLQALYFRVGPCKDFHAWYTGTGFNKTFVSNWAALIVFSLSTLLELSRTVAAMDLYWVGRGDDSWLWPTCNKHPSPPTIDTQLMSVKETWVCSALSTFVASNSISLVLSRPVFLGSLSAVSGVMLSYCWRKHNISCCFIIKQGVIVNLTCL